MSTARQPRGSELPGFPAEQGHRGDLVVTDTQGLGHGPQPVQVRRHMALFDGHPLADLHAGEAGGLLDGQAGALAGFLDALAEDPAPDLAAHIQNEGRGKGGELWHAHILTTPESATLSSKSRRGLNYSLSMYSVRFRSKGSSFAQQTENNTEMRIEYERILERVRQTKESVIRMNDRYFTAPTDEIEGTVESVSTRGITLKEFPGRVFQYSSVGTSAADMSARVLGENNNQTRSEVARAVDERRLNLQSWLSDTVKIGGRARLTVPLGAADHSEQIRAVVEVDGVNLNKELLDQGFPSFPTQKPSRTRTRAGPRFRPRLNILCVSPAGRRSADRRIDLANWNLFALAQGNDAVCRLREEMDPASPATLLAGDSRFEDRLLAALSRTQTGCINHCAPEELPIEPTKLPVIPAACPFLTAVSLPPKPKPTYSLKRVGELHFPYPVLHLWSTRGDYRGQLAAIGQIGYER
jgi:hypothetical protein